MSPRNITAILVTLALACVVGLGTLSPPSALPSAPGNDKLQHALAFAGLAFPIALLRPRWIPATVFILLAYGALIEVLQPLVGRDRDIADWIADLVGVVVGIAVALCLRALMHGLRRRMNRQPAA